MGVTVKKCHIIMPGNDCWNTVHFSCWQTTNWLTWHCQEACSRTELLNHYPTSKSVPTLSHSTRDAIPCLITQSTSRGTDTDAAWSRQVLQLTYWYGHMTHNWCSMIRHRRLTRVWRLWFTHHNYVTLCMINAASVEQSNCDDEIVRMLQFCNRCIYFRHSTCHCSYVRL